MARRSKPRLPAHPVIVNIESLSHEGRGVAHVDGKALFVDGALPGERVRVQYTGCHRRYDEGRCIEVIEASPHRVEPRCGHFGVCGGCSLQHMEPGAQLSFKQDTLLEHLAHIGKVEPATVLPALSGPLWAYRNKARLGVKYVPKRRRLMVGFRERATPLITELQHCDVLHASVGTRLRELTALIAGLQAYDSIAQVEVAIGDDTSALVLRNLTPLSEADRAALRQFAEDHGLHIYLQPARPDSVTSLWPADAGLTYRLPAHAIEIEFLPTDFTQVNPMLNRAMVDRALELLAIEPEHRVLDLFCGLGNFALPMARRALEVVGVEGEAGLVARAAQNAARNGIGNVQFHTANLAEPTRGAVWLSGKYPRILLDPPRTGAMEMLGLLPRLGAERIVYVSCQPSTLARDAGILVHEHGYRLLSVGVMDMFPHTAHVESIALFERR